MLTRQKSKEAANYDSNESGVEKSYLRINRDIFIGKYNKVRKDRMTRV